MKPLILALGTTLLLTGCGKADDAARKSPGPVTARQVAKAIDSVKLEPGEWEATQQILDVKMTGLPKGVPADAMQQMVGRTQTYKHCVTPEQAARPSADFLAAQKDSKCTYTNMTMAGGTIAATMACAVPDQPRGQMHMTMHGTYLPTSYAIAMQMDMQGMPNGVGMAMKMKSNGKRIGACPKSGATE